MEQKLVEQTLPSSQADKTIQPEKPVDNPEQKSGVSPGFGQTARKMDAVRMRPGWGRS